MATTKQPPNYRCDGDNIYVGATNHKGLHVAPEAPASPALTVFDANFFHPVFECRRGDDTLDAK